MGELSQLRRAVTGDDITSGLLVPGRLLASTVTLVSGWVCLSAFTARRTQTISSITVGTTATAAGATPTLCRLGIYSVNEADDCTLVASIANDTTLFAAANTTYSRNLTAPYELVLGQRYATAFLVVTAATFPSMVGVQLDSTAFTIAHGKTPPFQFARLTGQTNLPSSIAAASTAGLNALVKFQLNQTAV